MACNIVGINSSPGIPGLSFAHPIDNEWGLEDMYYIRKINSELGVETQADDNERLSEINFNEWRSTKELWLKLELVPLTGRTEMLDTKKAIQWARACQNPDGGFGFYPGSTSFTENCHLCLRILKRLGASPIDPLAVKDFIMGCRTATGGFARKNGSAPFLDATWNAIASLALLCNPVPRELTLGLFKRTNRRLAL